MVRYLLFVLVACAALISLISSTAVAVAFPQITSSFNVSLVTAGWVLSANLLATITTAPFLGKASDSFGRKRTFVVFLLLFSLGSFFCAISPNIYLLILARVIQGIGAGGFVPASAGIVSTAFPKSRPRMIGLITTIATFGTVLGPAVGGWLTESYGWRSIFLFALPWGLVIMVGALVFMKPDGPPKKLRLDARGIGLFSFSLAAAMVGITTLGNGNGGFWSLPVGIAALLLGALLMVKFIGHERTAAEPIIDRVLLLSRPFMAANFFNTVLGVAVGVLTFIPLYAVTVHGMSIFESGLITTPKSVSLMLASLIVTFSLHRLGYRLPMVLGWTILGIACSLFAAESTIVSRFLPGYGVWPVIVIVSLAGIGLGVCVPASNNACIDMLPERVSTITGVRQTFRNLGSTLAIAATSIALQASGDYVRGFNFVFAGAALIVFASIPAIFLMPRSAYDRAPADVRAELASG